MSVSKIRQHLVQNRIRAMPIRDQLIKTLKANKGHWISGESLSTTLNVTRAAVWKQIGSLRKDGYLIEASPKKGYLFKSCSQRVLPDEICDGLKTRVFGKKGIVHVLEAESTNILIKEQADRGAPEGTIALSEGQKKGRGRKGRTWFSPHLENIYLSFLLRPPIPLVEAPRLTLLTAVVAAENLLASTGLQVTIRWPNDIYYREKKLAGVLAEIKAEMDLVDYVAVGIGINVNTERFPEKLKNDATSIFLETGKPFSRSELITDFLNRFEAAYFRFLETGFAPVCKKWKSLSDMLGRQVRVDRPAGHCCGEVTDVDDEGALLIKDKKSHIHRIAFGDVRLR
jgi:BirA family biotin operon repressor/biotin-[acetyl-CoA-carboxylase] ligase